VTQKKEEIEIIMCGEKAKKRERYEFLERQMPVSLEEKWEKIKQVIHGALVKKRIRKKNKELENKDWWDRRYKKEKNGKETILDVEKREN